MAERLFDCCFHALRQITRWMSLCGVSVLICISISLDFWYPAYQALVPLLALEAQLVLHLAIGNRLPDRVSTISRSCSLPRNGTPPMGV
ncbi:MAG: hypothetical protein ACJ73N_06350 [Bryobacteraceae bacterium]|jgi:hypothetical protein